MAKKILKPDPFRGFVNQDNPYFYVSLGVIRRVDPQHMKCDVAILTGGNATRYELDLTQGMAGPRSFWGGVPEVGSVVVLGYRRKHQKLFEPVILGYLPVGMRTGSRFDPYGATSPSDISEGDRELYEEIYGKPVRYKRLLLDEGDAGGMSSRGAEFALTTDVQAVNRAGDGFHFRESDRTFLVQSRRWYHTSSGATLVSGPIQRNKLLLPSSFFGSDGKILPEYQGSSVLQSIGYGDPGGSFKLLQSDGSPGEFVNNEGLFPSTTFQDGSKTYFVSTSPDENPEVAGALLFTEHTLSLPHTTDLTGEVTADTDGVDVEPTRNLVEITHGTVVGNDPWTTGGMRNYGKILKPSLFPDFRNPVTGNTRFTLNPISRTPTNGDIEAYTQAGAFLYQMRPPQGDTPFVVSISKQGKLFLQVPGSTVEDQQTNNISIEALLVGALKAKVGASNPDRVSLNLSLDGGIHADIGSDSSGKAVSLRFRSSVHQSYQGTPDTDDVALRTEIQGVSQRSVSGEDFSNIIGSKLTTVSGRYQLESDRMVVNAISGFSGNYGEKNELVAGKTQLNHALQVLETIVAGGKVTTILAGGSTETIAAGLKSVSVLGGAYTTNVAAGAYTVTVGAGAISLSTGAGAVALSTGAGAMSLTAGAGAMTLTAGLAINLAAPLAISLASPQVLLGGPLAVLGVVRGAPVLPPGVPSLDFLLNIPYLGSAVIRSILYPCLSSILRATPFFCLLL